MDNKSTGMGSDAFFRDPPKQTAELAPAAAPVSEKKKRERRSFNLSPDMIRLLDNTQHVTAQRGEKMTLSAIVELGIKLAAEQLNHAEG